MEAYTQYIKPELLVLVGVLYITGNILKRSHEAPDWLIPAILGGFSVLLSLAWVVSTCQPHDGYAWLQAVFTAVVQGLLIAGQAVYLHQLGHQRKKRQSPAQTRTQKGHKGINAKPD